jgi:hypothetical protein
VQQQQVLVATNVPVVTTAPVITSALVNVPVLQAADASRAQLQLGEVEEGNAFPEAEELSAGPVQQQVQQQQQQQPVYMMASTIPQMQIPMQMQQQQQVVQMPMFAQTPMQQPQNLAFAQTAGPGILQVAAPTTQLLPAGMGTAPATLVVDTGPDAMVSTGLSPVPQKQQRGIPRSGSAATASRPRSPRPNTGTTSSTTSTSSSSGQGNAASSQVKVNIIKQGSK